MHWFFFLFVDNSNHQIMLFKYLFLLDRIQTCKKSVLMKLVSKMSPLCWMQLVLPAFWKKETVSSMTTVLYQRSPIPFKAILLRNMLALEKHAHILIENRSIIIQENLITMELFYPASNWQSCNLKPMLSSSLCPFNLLFITVQPSTPNVLIFLIKYSHISTSESKLI